jgi:hypothetical protein
MSYDNLSCVSYNLLKFYQLFTGEERRIPFIFDDFHLTKIYPPLPTSVQPISITKTLQIVPTKNERDPPLFTGKLLIKFENILRNTTQVIIQNVLKFYQQLTGEERRIPFIFDDFHFCCSRVIGLDMMENTIILERKK